MYDDEQADKAVIQFAGTTVTSGCGYIYGRDRLYLRRPVGDRNTVLVLGPDNGLHGGLRIDLALVNRGVVDPTDPEDANGTHWMQLYCQPKVGPGDWRITAGGTGTNTMVIDTPIVGTGNLVLGSSAILNVNAHVSLYGTMTAGPGCYITVGKGIMFDVDRFPLADCPQ